MDIFLIVLYVIGFAILSAIAANAKNRDPVGWFFIGFLFGIFGLAAALIVAKVDPSSSPNNSGTSMAFDASTMNKKCPDCAEMVKLEARVCRFCHRQFSETELASQIAKAEAQFTTLQRAPSMPVMTAPLNSEVQALKAKFLKHPVEKLQKMKQQGRDHWSEAALVAVDQLLSERRRLGN
jgi:hypothetical protein